MTNLKSIAACIHNGEKFRRIISTADIKGAVIEIEYAVIIEETSDNGFEYGVTVALVNTSERVNVRGITIRPERIAELLLLLMRNTVTPVTVRDVIYDWL